jgi:hypothetical protein
MGPHLRRMKSYHPRKRSKKSGSEKQMLKDLKHKISGDIGKLFVFIEEGNTEQASLAMQQAKNEFLKHSTEMQKIAQKLGDRCASAVRDYLDSVDTIVHSQTAWVDEAKIRHCQMMTQKLEKELAVA